MMRGGIGIIGCGAIGSALAGGIVEKGVEDPADVRVLDIDPARIEKLVNKLKVQPAAGTGDIFANCTYIFIAVKPQDVESALREFQPLVQPHHVIISAAAGISTTFIESRLPAGSKVIRIMPNTPCLIGQGAVAVSSGGAVTGSEIDNVEKLLEPLGLTVSIPEHLMDAVTGLSGTGPAYVFLFIESLIDSGVMMGLSRDVASRLTIQTIIGATMLLLQENGIHPAELRYNVTSPGGTTCAAIEVLEEKGFRNCLTKAVTAATLRAGEFKRD